MNSSLRTLGSPGIRRIVRRVAWFFGLLILAALMVSCKKTSFVPASAAAANGATPGGGAISSNAADQPGSVKDRLKAVEAGPAEDQHAPEVLPDWKPVNSSTSSIVIPLVTGLVVDGVISDKYGDHETIRAVQEITPQSVNFKLAGDLLQRPGGNGSVTLKRVTGYRIVDTADLANVHRLMHFFEANKTEHYRGSVARSASAEVLSHLHEGQPSQYDFQNDVKNMLSEQPSGHATLSESLIQWNGSFLYECTLRRVEAADLSAPVLVNVTASNILTSNADVFVQFLATEGVTRAASTSPMLYSKQEIKFDAPGGLGAQLFGLTGGAQNTTTLFTKTMTRWDPASDFCKKV